MAIQINKLLLKIGSQNNKGDNKGLVRTILSQDFFNQGSNLPKLFALLEISSPDNQQTDDIINILNIIELKISDRIQKIYQSINERKSFQAEDLSEHLLELILKSLNGEIKYLLEERNCSELLKNINLFIGIIEPFFNKDSEEKYHFHFSYLNNIKNLLIYKQGDKYNLMDVIKSNNEETSEINKGKIFSNILSGELDNNSFLAICNQNLIDYVILDKLKQVIISMDIGEALGYFKKILREIDTVEETSFAAIFIYLTGGERKDIAPKNSIERLIVTEKNTEKLLSPSIIPDFEKIFKNLFLGIKNIYKKIRLSIIKLKNKIFKFKKRKKLDKNKVSKTDDKTKETQQGEIIIEKPKPKKKSKLIILTANLVKSIGKGMGKLITAIQNVLVKIINTVWSKKILIIGFTISILLFYQVTVWLNTKKTEEKTEITYNQTFIEIEGKLESLEASLIYKNYDKANEIIAEITPMMEKTSASTIPEYVKKYKNLKKTIDEYNQKINKVEIVETPTAIALETQNNSINNIILNNGYLALIDYANKKINIFDTVKEKTTEWDISENEIDISDAPISTNSEDGFILYSNNQLHSFNIADKKIQKINKTFTDGDISDIEEYADNIYALDQKNNQIYLYKYQQGKEWINDSSTELSNAIDIVIDGNIFILKNNGSILKYFKGEKQNFALQEINPKLKKPAKFYTDSDSDYLYILEPSNKRIIIYEKETANSTTNNLMVQYTSSKFTNLKDFAIDEKNKIIYVLNGNEIFKINISFPTN